jgi:hypothetical protein
MRAYDHASEPVPSTALVPLRLGGWMKKALGAGNAENGPGDGRKSGVKFFFLTLINLIGLSTWLLHDPFLVDFLPSQDVKSTIPCGVVAKGIGH